MHVLLFQIRSGSSAVHRSDLIENKLYHYVHLPGLCGNLSQYGSNAVLYSAYQDEMDGAGICGCWPDTILSTGGIVHTGGDWRIASEFCYLSSCSTTEFQEVFTGRQSEKSKIQKAVQHPICTYDERCYTTAVRCAAGRNWMIRAWSSDSVPSAMETMNTARIISLRMSM